jgi:hypothetical protein
MFVLNKIKSLERYCRSGCQGYQGRYGGCSQLGKNTARLRDDVADLNGQGNVMMPFLQWQELLSETE